MDFDSTHRRAFLSAIVGAIAAPIFILRKASAAANKPAATISFFVAGVRFQLAVTGLAVGTAVRIVPSQFDGARSYAVWTIANELIGYVPKDIVPLVPGLEDRRARLSVVDYEALPWMRFEVTVNG